MRGAWEHTSNLFVDAREPAGCVNFHADNFGDPGGAFCALHWGLSLRARGGTYAHRSIRRVVSAYSHISAPAPARSPPNLRMRSPSLRARELEGARARDPLLLRPQLGPLCAAGRGYG